MYITKYVNLIFENYRSLSTAPIFIAEIIIILFIYLFIYLKKYYLLYPHDTKIKNSECKKYSIQERYILKKSYF